MEWLWNYCHCSIRLLVTTRYVRTKLSWSKPKVTLSNNAGLNKPTDVNACARGHIQRTQHKAFRGVNLSTCMELMKAVDRGAKFRRKKWRYELFKGKLVSVWHIVRTFVIVVVGRRISVIVNIQKYCAGWGKECPSDRQTASEKSRKVTWYEDEVRSAYKAMHMNVKIGIGKKVKAWMLKWDFGRKFAFFWNLRRSHIL